MCSVHSEECFVKALCSSIFFFSSFRLNSFQILTPTPGFKFPFCPSKQSYMKYWMNSPQWPGITLQNRIMSLVVFHGLPWSSWKPAYKFSNSGIIEMLFATYQMVIEKQLYAINQQHGFITLPQMVRYRLRLATRAPNLLVDINRLINPATLLLKIH